MLQENVSCRGEILKIFQMLLKITLLEVWEKIWKRIEMYGKISFGYVPKKSRGSKILATGVGEDFVKFYRVLKTYVLPLKCFCQIQRLDAATEGPKKYSSRSLTKEKHILHKKTTYIEKSCKTQTQCPIRGKEYPQFNHGEKKSCISSRRKKLHAQKVTNAHHTPLQKSNSTSLRKIENKI